MNPEWVKMFQELQNDKEYQKSVKSLIEDQFEKIKDKYIDEFLNHPVTQEIKGGISASNISGTLNSITNLYSFIGFDEGTDPIQPIEELLEKSNYRIIYNSNSGESTVIFDIPTAAQIFAITPMPWAVGRSWARGIETGISGLGYYLKKVKNSRSGLGIQSTIEQVRTGASFKNTKYISDLINRFSKDLKELNKLKI
jgi:mRNA-degrading endonuclease RelE of RelBE toxin-antitoxin system